MDIAKMLKDAIKAKGFTMAQVASQMKNERNGGIGISQPAFSDMVKGNIPFSRVAEIASIIDIPLTSLVSSMDTSDVFTCPNCGQRFRIVPIEAEPDEDATPATMAVVMGQI